MDSNRQRNNPEGEPTNSVPSSIHSSRRSSRKAVFLPIWLRHDEKRPIWEEETETQVVSRYGARLSCRHFVQADSIVIVLRRDNGQRAKARVTHVRYDPDGKREVGIEFIDKDNFWDLDWDSSRPVEAQPGYWVRQANETEENASAEDVTGCGEPPIDAAEELPSAEEIRNRAYTIYLERGTRDGHDLDDWLEAECELRTKCRAGREVAPPSQASPGVAITNRVSGPIRGISAIDLPINSR